MASTTGIDPASTSAGTGAYVQVRVSGTYKPLSGLLLGVNDVPVAASSKLYLP